MKKIICPKCGEVQRYGIVEHVRRVLLFDADNEPCGATEDVTTYSGDAKRCLYCDRKVKIVDEQEDIKA